MHLGRVEKFDASADAPSVEERLQIFLQGQELPGPFLRRIGRGREPSQQFIPGIHPVVREAPAFVSDGNEARYLFVGDVAAVHLRVFRDAVPEQGFVAGHEIARRRPFVPHEEHVAVPPEDSFEFGFRAFEVEPVEGLCDRDSVDGSIPEARMLGGPVDGVKRAPAPERAFRVGAHFPVGFHGEHRPVSLQKRLREYPRPGSDIGDDRSLGEAEVRAHVFKNRLRVGGPVFHVIGHAIRESFRVVVH